MRATLKKAFIYFMTMTFAAIGFTQPVRAAMLSTDQVYSTSAAQGHRDRVRAALDRPEFRSQLEQMGVSKVDAEARVAALSDDEAAALAARVDSLPAGGDFFAVVGIVVIVLIVTDLIGWTDVFPFIRPVR